MQLLSAKAVMPVMISYQLEDNINEAIVYVDYGQDQVYFPHHPELNTEEMRLAILAALDSPLNAFVPKIPQEVLDQIEQVRSGKYNNKGIIEF